MFNRTVGKRRREGEREREKKRESERERLALGWVDSHLDRGDIIEVERGDVDVPFRHKQLFRQLFSRERLVLKLI